jgi:lysozyme
MRTSNEGKVEILGHEGISLSKYKDSVGVWTIAGGITKTEIPDLASWPLSKTITMQQVFEMLEKALIPYEDELNKYLTKSIPQTQYDALVSWSYNVGWGWDKKASVIGLINRGASGQSLYDALMLYNKPKEDIPRRVKEAKLLRDGVYSEGGKADLFPVSSNGYPMYSKGRVINVWQYIPHTSSTMPTIPAVSPSQQKGAEIKPSLIAAALTWFTGANR